MQDIAWSLQAGSTCTTNLLLQLVQQQVGQLEVAEMIRPNLQLKVVLGVSLRACHHSSTAQE